MQKKDKEGNTSIEYAPPTEFSAEMWPGRGKVQAEMYGNRLPGIRNLRIDGRYQEVRKGRKVSYQITDGPEITVNDGICIYDQEPDYKVIAIYPYRFLTLEVEKL